ncbi:hypothetical protein A3781_06355 [Bacillus badius]|nr:hypothetical protein A3781_06355 [Bacillus badius]
MARRRLTARPAESEAAWNGKQPGPSARKIKSTANVSFSSLITAGGFHFQIDIAVRHPLFVHSVDCNGRREDSCGTSGTGEIPQALWRGGGSPPAPRKAKQPGMEINSPHLQAKEKDCGQTSSFIEFICSLKRALFQSARFRI